MTHVRKIILASLLGIGALRGISAQPPAAPRQPAPAKQGEATEPIDFVKARELFQRRERGDRLTEDERAYLERAIAARRGGNRPATDRRVPMPHPQGERTGLVPLSDRPAEDRYQGEDGGLYGVGRNTPPESHRVAAERELARIQPLDREGQPDSKGLVGFVSISMSNATQEFSRFKRLADRDEDKSPQLRVIDCAQGGQAMAEWAPPDARPWKNAEMILANAGVSPQQVQVAWIKLANKGPRGELSEHGRQLQRDSLAVIHNAKHYFPNLRIAYLSSRVYGGYATSNLNPEPYAYESAYPVRWLIQDQIRGDEALRFDATDGKVRAPLLLWGPYLWADGLTPRSDGLVWRRDDLAQDGTHPSEAGRDKVARMMLEFFKTDPLARPWFIGHQGKP